MRFGKAVAAAGALLGVVALDCAARALIRRHERLDLDTIGLPGSRFWIRGTAIHYVERGAGVPVVLVHGFGGSTFSFRSTMPALAARFRVIAVDLPGFGFSGQGQLPEYSQTAWAALLAEFLDRLGIARAVLVGHSLGGGVVQRLALLRPDLVDRLILVASVSAAEPARDATPPGVSVLVRGVQAAMLLWPRLLTPLVRRVAHDPAFMSGEVLRGYLRPMQVVGSAAAMRRIMRDRRNDVPVSLDGIQVPALLIWGEYDRTVPISVGLCLQSALAGSRLEVVPNAAHLPLEERPEICNALILGFLDGQSDISPDPRNRVLRSPGTSTATDAGGGMPDSEIE